MTNASFFFLFFLFLLLSLSNPSKAKLHQEDGMVRLLKHTQGQWKSEGAGAKVKRVIGTQEISNLDPFLLLDFFKVQLPGGFPDHPHRGFETVTYMIHGSVLHEDFNGNSGELGPGDIQWMTAGKGIVHAEMPSLRNKYSVGFQLWVNLEASKKFIEPQYQEYKSEKIPEIEGDGVIIRLIAGNAFGKEGLVKPRSESTFWDVHLKQKNAVFEIVVEEEWNGLVYKYEGLVAVGENLLVDEDSEGFTFVSEKNKNKLIIRNLFEGESKFILITGKPLKEPIHQRGPFVLASKDDLAKTFADYRKGINGFENAHGWSSKIRSLAK